MDINNCRYLLLFALLISHCVTAQKTAFPISTKTDKVSIVYGSKAPKLDSIAACFLADDIERVTAFKPVVLTDITKAAGPVIVIGAIDAPLIRKFISSQSPVHKSLLNQWERFAYKTIEKPFGNISKALVIAGSDVRGTAYGVFTLSEKIGVSPWYWWADVPVKKQSELLIRQPDFVSSTPSVKYRGIFINDEDWGLQPWAAKTFEPETGDIGPKTYAKVFELLLRLKANLIWPAMHPSTKAFFHYPGNVTTAGDYQIIIGSSHAEPMLRNNVDEWDVKTMGHFNYFTNKERIIQYWEDRIRQSKGINAMYTLGMRGVHDGQMEGIKDLKEAVPVVEKIIGEERELLAKHVNRDVTALPQVLTPYKEVLDIYDYGLKVPEDVTLVWPDDNYGYIHRLNNEKEVKRKGGSGVYYHASYWGRPHDYLWLSSTHPSLVREEMIKAYQTGADKVWVLNVGDIKPLEYNMQQFLDMAYDAGPFLDSRFVKTHLYNWVNAIFGKEQSQDISHVLWDYYQLAFERRPEFMGWSRTEPTTQTTFTEYNHFFYGDEAQRRINQYEALEDAVTMLKSKMQENSNAFYQLVYYPVIGASLMNKKFLYRDKAYFYAKQNRWSAREYASLSKAAFDSIVAETEYYNNELAGGKWKGMMSYKPRDLPVYQAPVLPPIDTGSTEDWNIAPEGYVTKDSSLLRAGGAVSLPHFDVYNRQQYFVDIFLTKNQPVKWAASVSHDWIRLSKRANLLSAERGKSQARIWVDIDWSKITKKEKVSGSIMFTGNGKQIAVNIQASKEDKPELLGYDGYMENNGFVSIHAAHFSRQTQQPSMEWKVIDGLGYTGSVLQAFPLSVKGKPSATPDAIKTNNSYVAYDFYTFSSADPVVTVMALPTHPLNNNYGVQYAVSIDDGPLKVIDLKTWGRSEEWKQNVLRNRAERKIEMPYLKAGKHTLKIYCIDPGVILDEIRIDLGGLKKAYSVLPETKPEPASKNDHP